MNNQKDKIRLLSKSIFCKFSQSYKDDLLNFVRGNMMYDVNTNQNLRVLLIILKELRDIKK